MEELQQIRLLRHPILHQDILKYTIITTIIMDIEIITTITITTIIHNMQAVMEVKIPGREVVTPHILKHIMEQRITTSDFI
jgi:hypothetical protein